MITHEGTFDVLDLALSPQGKQRALWAAQEMPVLRQIEQRFAKEQPLRGLRLGACLHITSETANLMRTLVAGGAQIALCASNPLSTQDDIAAYCAVELNIPTYGIKGEDTETYYKHLNAVLDTKPNLTMDDGCDLVSTLHSKRTELLEHVIGGSEETTTGVIRLRAMARDGALRYPIIAVNDANTKHLFDNRYGTGQSTVDGIIRATNLLLAGKSFVVCGYGWCGRGVAMRARGMGALVIITEVNPLRALEAALDGYQVMLLNEAAKVGDVFVTLTGDTSVLRREHFEVMKDCAIIANSGHFDVEIAIPELEAMSTKRESVKPMVEQFTLKDGRRIFLLGEGRLINLAAAEGHPASVMDMSFANQSLCAEHLAKHAKQLKPDVYPVPPEIDREIAALKLAAMGIAIDQLTPEQQKYLSSWEIGT